MSSQNQSHGVSWALSLLVQFAAMLVALFAIGMATRMAAIALFNVNYGMHAVLAAPFLALVVTAFLARGGSFIAFSLAGGVFAVALGMMSPVMGVSFLLPLICSAVAAGMAGHGHGAALPSSKVAVAAGAAYSALCYPATILAGALFSNHALALGDGAFFLLASALAAVGCLIGARLSR